MRERIITDSNGRKHITNEPLLHKPAQQEPVVRWDSDGWGDLLVDSLPDGTLLYTSPPAQRTWVGLTDGDLAGCDEFEYKSACFWEAKLKEKNT